MTLRKYGTGQILGVDNEDRLPTVLGVVTPETGRPVWTEADEQSLLEETGE